MFCIQLCYFGIKDFYGRIDTIITQSFFLLIKGSNEENKENTKNLYYNGTSFLFPVSPHNGN